MSFISMKRTNNIAKSGRISANSFPVAQNVVVNKKEKYSMITLLIFVNETLDCELVGMDDLITGAVYCQILHRVYPKTIPINKVKMYTASSFEFRNNYKLLQASFDKLNVTQNLPSDDLMNGRGHLDFCNWILKFYMTNIEERDYNPKEARNYSAIGLERPKATGSRRPQKARLTLSQRRTAWLNGIESGLLKKEPLPKVSEMGSTCASVSDALLMTEAQADSMSEASLLNGNHQDIRNTVSKVSPVKKFISEASQKGTVQKLTEMLEDAQRTIKKKDYLIRELQTKLKRMEELLVKVQRRPRLVERNV